MPEPLPLDGWSASGDTLVSVAHGYKCAVWPCGSRAEVERGNLWDWTLLRLSGRTETHVADASVYSLSEAVEAALAARRAAVEGRAGG